jgi:hypothetical protein
LVPGGDGLREEEEDDSPLMRVLMEYAAEAGRSFAQVQQEIVRDAIVESQAVTGVALRANQVNQNRNYFDISAVRQELTLESLEAAILGLDEEEPAPIAHLHLSVAPRTPAPIGLTNVVVDPNMPDDGRWLLVSTPGPRSSFWEQQEAIRRRSPHAQGQAVDALCTTENEFSHRWITRQGERPRVAGLPVNVSEIPHQLCSIDSDAWVMVLTPLAEEANRFLVMINGQLIRGEWTVTDLEISHGIVSHLLMRNVDGRHVDQPTEIGGTYYSQLSLYRSEVNGEHLEVRGRQRLPHYSFGREEPSGSVLGPASLEF